MKKLGSIASALFLLTFVVALMVLDEPSAVYAQGGKTATPRPTGITSTPAPVLPTATRPASAPVAPVAPEGSRPGSQTIPGIGNININPGQIPVGLEQLSGLVGGLGSVNLGALVEAITNPEKFITKVVINIRTAWFPYEFWAAVIFGIAMFLFQREPPKFSAWWVVLVGLFPAASAGMVLGYAGLMFGLQLLGRRR